MTLRVAVYLRQSMDRTGEGEGVDRQREDVMRLIAARGWRVVREYVDNDVSATKRKPRPQFVEMMKAVDNGEVDVIMSKHLDRLLRQPIELEDVLDRTEAVRAWVVTSADGIDTSTDGGRTVARIMVSIAKGEIERKSARHKAANLQAAQAGKWVGGRRAFGYKADGVTIEPAEAELVRQGYSELLAGVSRADIARRWAERSTTPQGKPWTFGAVGDVLANARNAGLRNYRPEPGQLATKRRNPEAGLLTEAQWPAIVDEATWRSACRIMADPSRRRGTPGKALLTGVLFCGVCGGKVIRGGNGTGRILYKCKVGTCVAQSCDLVDAYVEATILRVYRRPEVAHLFAHETAEVDVKALMARAKALRDRLQDIKDDYTDALISREERREMTASTQSRLADVESQLAQAGGSPAVAKLVAAEDMQAEWDSYSIAAKRELIALLCTVKLHKTPRRRKSDPVFNTDTVTFDPKRKDTPILIE